MDTGGSPLAWGSGFRVVLAVLADRWVLEKGIGKGDAVLQGILGR